MLIQTLKPLKVNVRYDILMDIGPPSVVHHPLITECPLHNPTRQHSNEIQDMHTFL